MFKKSLSLLETDSVCLMLDSFYFVSGLTELLCLTMGQ